MVQFFGVPGAEEATAVTGADCVVVALKSRSIPAASAVALSLEAVTWLESLGVAHIYFKYCSTFDSTDRGNIGPVADALAVHRGEQVMLFVPSAPENGRTVYRSQLFVGDELLAESPMRQHPINPMTRSDIRTLLRAQSTVDVASVFLPDVLAGADTVLDRLRSWPGRVNVVGDAVTEQDMDVWGQVAARRRLSSGSAGLASGLARTRKKTGEFELPQPPAGPRMVLAGSCSAATRAQVTIYRLRHPSMFVDPEQLVRDGDRHLAAIRAFVAGALRVGQSPLVYSTAPPEDLAGVQERVGTDRAAQALEAATGEIARYGVTVGVRRLIVAGGETSGAVVDALGLPGVAVGTEVAPGVPWVITLGPVPLGLLLKSGNFGGPEFFGEAVQWQ